MALKNAYSSMPIDNIFANLQKMLVAHGAKQIVFDYGDDGKIYGLTFTIKHQERLLHIQLPARLKEAKQLLREQGFRYDNEQVYRVAWILLAKSRTSSRMRCVYEAGASAAKRD